MQTSKKLIVFVDRDIKLFSSFLLKSLRNDASNMFINKFAQLAAIGVPIAVLFSVYEKIYKTRQC